MKRLICAVAAGAFFLPGIAVGYAGPNDMCVERVSAQFPICRSTAQGIVLGADRDEVDRIFEAVRDGEERYRTHLGSVTKYAVLINGDRAAQDTVRAAGFPVIMPWLSQAERLQRVTASVRRAAESQLGAQNLSEAEKEQRIQEMSAHVLRQQAERADRSHFAVAHELGHQWFLNSYWGGRSGNVEGQALHYAGPAPDWLDEVAAILMEDDQLTAPRRKQFRELYNGRAAGRVESLSDYLSMTHPMLGAVTTMIAAGELGAKAGGSGVITLTPAELQNRLGVAPEAGVNFYAQGRVFGDFLIAQSGDRKILGHIAKAISAGQSFEQWLSSEGRRHLLGATVLELDETWKAWLESEYRDRG
jgi:hypothetical protein